MVDPTHTPGPRTPGPRTPGPRTPGPTQPAARASDDGGILAIGSTETETAGGMTVSGIDLEDGGTLSLAEGETLTLTNTA